MSLNRDRAISNPAGEQLVLAIQEYAQRIAVGLGPVVARRFEQMMLDTWCFTMAPRADRVFVITGDIPAMWLRDSSAQVLPLLRLTHIPEVNATLRGLVREQWRCIALDPYANAFNDSDSGAHFEPMDSCGVDGRGTPVGYTGMTWSGFRPSDDVSVYGYNIPAQLMALKALRMIEEFAHLWQDQDLADDAARLHSEIARGVEEYGVVDGRFAYEVDGLGGQLFMDDANMPSLLSLPLTSDVQLDDPRYLATREWILSDANPYFFRGSHAKGIGSPHTPEGYVWHIGLAVQGLTGTTQEAHDCLQTILTTDGGTGWTHESFDPSDPTRFTRAWFSWSNSMTCELMLKLVEPDGP